MPRSRSLSVKRKKPDSQSDSSQECSLESGQVKSKGKKHKAVSASTKETILAHFEKRAPAEMANSKITGATDVTDSGTIECDSEGEEEPTNRDIVLLIKSVNRNLSTKIDNLSETVEMLKGDVFTLKQENEKLKEQLQEYQKREEEMQRKVNEAAFQAKRAHEQADNNEQYSRRNNIKLLYVEEKRNGAETAEESEEKAIHVFHHLLNLKHIKPEDIEAAHRIGERKAGQTRPIIVKFLSRKIKTEVIQNRRKLKNSSPKIVIVEDLTKNNYILYRKAADHPGTLRCWTTDGRIFAKDLDSRIHRIESTTDLTKISFSAGTPPSAQVRRQQFGNRGNRRADDIRSPPRSQTANSSRGGGTRGN